MLQSPQRLPPLADSFNYHHNGSKFSMLSGSA